jgi:hypothetical protein
LRSGSKRDWCGTIGAQRLTLECRAARAGHSLIDDVPPMSSRRL